MQTASCKRKPETEKDEEEEEEETTNNNESLPSCTGTFSSIQITPQPILVKKKKTGPIARQNELIEKACVLLSAPPPSSSSSLALVWTDKLNRLEANQRLFAEKAINDILFEAELGTLHRNSVQINNSSNTSSTPNRSTVDFYDLNSAVIEIEDQRVQPSTDCSINNIAQLFSSYNEKD